MRQVVLAGVCGAILIGLTMNQAQAGPYVAIAVGNNTNRLARFVIKRGDGTVILDTRYLDGRGRYKVQPGEYVVTAGDPNTFKVVAYVWNRSNGQWVQKAARGFSNPGHDFAVEFYKTSNGTSFNLSEF